MKQTCKGFLRNRFPQAPRFLARANFLAALAVALIFLPLSSRAQDLASVRGYEKALRAGSYVSIPWKKLYPNGEAIRKDLPTLKRFLRDSAESVRSAGYKGLTHLPALTQDTGLLRETVALLLEGSQDPSRRVAHTCGKGLRGFPKVAFTGQEERLWGALGNTPSQRESLVRLIGYVHPAGAVSKLKHFRQSGKIKTRKERWAAQLALIRLNDLPTVQRMLSRLQANPVTDAMVYDLFPELLYTRNKEIYDFLVTVLQSNSIRCESANPDNTEDLPCAYRVMELLAPYIQDFPLPV
ncbi:MAG: hypothetical protein MI749_18920, partial [Desulfovibrionales bacterium]|nr:hypothetical protein [Desulfovibrionales bacterium]